MIASIPASYPFEKVVADYFSQVGFKYLLYADRYSGWISTVKIKPNEGDSKFLKSFFNNLFAVFGVPVEISTDGGPPFNSHNYAQFLKKWGITPRLSSAHYPQSNGRAELAVKSAKRILIGNSDKNGNIDNDRVARALLQHRNTPLQDIGLSPAQILYGRNLNDCMPSLHDAMMVREEWRVAADEREIAMRKRHVRSVDAYNEHTKELPELEERDFVAVQNQHGNKPGRWDRTGIVIDKLPYRQYRIKMDGSNRPSIRNRRFLRKIDPICAEPSGPVVVRTSTSRADSAKETIVDQPTSDQRSAISTQPTPSPLQPLPPSNPTPSQPSPPSTSSETVQPSSVRRSSRNTVPRRVFEAQHHGKSHSERALGNSGKS